MALDAPAWQRIYPTAMVVAQPLSDPRYISLPLPAKEGYIAIDRHPLSASETALLETLAQEQAPRIKEPWYAFLTGQTTDAPQSFERLRVVQLRVTMKDASVSRQDFMAAVTGMFPRLLAHFWVDQSYALFVEPDQEKDPDQQKLSDFAQVLAAMETDFYANIQIYVGNFWQKDDPLPALFAEEQRIFTSVKATKAESDLATQSLAYFTTPTREQSAVYQTLRQRLAQMPEYAEVIVALYHHQGNMTSAAKALYLHRNTLQYRIDKFQELTGWSLRDMDHLTLCYLLLID
jgi:DNA-binding PucR family transcriptional regulator